MRKMLQVWMALLVAGCGAAAPSVAPTQPGTGAPTITATALPAPTTGAPAAFPTEVFAAMPREPVAPDLSAQMQKIVAEQAGDLKQYGLDRPSQTVTVTSGSSRATLLLGISGNDGLFAKDAS